MIKGKKQQPRILLDKPTIKYREIDALNQSMLKLFDSDPVKFYEEFKLGKRRKDKKSTALIIGDLVDFYLLECHADEDTFVTRFDEKFALYEGVKGTGQVFTLVDNLFEITMKDTEDGKVSTSFDTRFSEACKKTQAEGKYKGKSEDKILEDFEKNGQIYFQTLLVNADKTVVDISLVDKAKVVANNILTDPFTADIFNNSLS